MLNTAIILAGGFGTRLQSVVADVPKPMAPINGEPFLNYQLSYLKHYGIKNIVFSTGYLAEKISEYYKTNVNGLTISYSHESSPLGTGGGIKLAMDKTMDNDVFVLNGDSFFDVDLKEFYNQHLIHQANFSIAIRNVQNANRYGTIELSPYFLKDSSPQLEKDFFKIKSFVEKSESNSRGYINGGIYILNKEQYLKHTKTNSAFSIEKNFFELQCQIQNIGAFFSNGYFIDIGIPEDYLKAQHDFKEFKYR
ncbi:MAG: nucleotidyltransferase family protein [Bacteroidota bacterium]|nr:nucleotidyltransferase family protein [Bacteroidota bacterium]